MRKEVLGKEIKVEDVLESGVSAYSRNHQSGVLFSGNCKTFRRSHQTA